MATILVIDNDEQIRNLYRIMLIRDGHQIFTAKDGVEGIQSFNQSKPDLVITGIFMPNKNGLEVIMELLQCHPKVPIIAIYGDLRHITTVFGLDSFEKLGVKGALQKPFAHQQLQEMICVALS
jgi:DNA-binding NtrC family response regulator